MKELIWKDATSYSRNDSERIPTVWELELGEYTIMVHRHIYYKDTWLLTCREMGVDKINLNTDAIEKAQTIAIKSIISLVEVKIAKMKKVIDALKGQEE